MRLADIWALLKRTFSEWGKDKCSRLAAAVAYYAIFSLGPLLLIAISIAGMVFGEEAAKGQLAERLEALVGREGAAAVQVMVSNAGKQSAGLIASAIGIVTMVLGAMGIFGALQDALNTIWDVEVKPKGGILGAVRARVLSFLMVLGTGFVLVASLVASSVLSALVGVLGSVPGTGDLGLVLQGTDFVISISALTLLFAVIFKAIPDTRIAWQDVWLGSVCTALLFTVGKIAIGLYLGRAGIGSAYGAAGSLVVLLVWIYYSAQILLFGAELTKVFADLHGSRRAMGVLRPVPGG